MLYELLCDASHPYPRRWPVADQDPIDPNRFDRNATTTWPTRSAAAALPYEPMAAQMRGDLLQIRESM
jgi:hypothetical protein